MCASRAPSRWGSAAATVASAPESTVAPAYRVLTVAASVASDVSPGPVTNTTRPPAAAERDPDCNHSRADGMTDSRASVNAGSRAHGAACSAAGGTMTTRSGSRAASGPSSASCSLAPTFARPSGRPYAARRRENLANSLSRNAVRVGPRWWRVTRPLDTSTAYRQPRTSTRDTSASVPTASTASGMSRVVADPVAPVSARVRRRTAASCRARSRRARAKAPASVSGSARRAPASRAPASAAANSASSGGCTGGDIKAVARHRSDHHSRLRADGVSQAADRASSASSRPWSVARARSSTSPNEIRYSSRASRPRRQACSSPRRSEAAALRRAPASHPVARFSAGPVCRARAASRSSPVRGARPTETESEAPGQQMSESRLRGLFPGQPRRETDDRAQLADTRLPGRDECLDLDEPGS